MDTFPLPWTSGVRSPGSPRGPTTKVLVNRPFLTVIVGFNHFTVYKTFCMDGFRDCIPTENFTERLIPCAAMTMDELSR